MKIGGLTEIAGVDNDGGYCRGELYRRWTMTEDEKTGWTLQEWTVTEETAGGGQ